jgi:hypothetical protein
VSNATGMLRPRDAAPAPRAADERAALLAAAGLAAGVLDARAYVEITVPRTAVRGRMRLLTRAEVHQVRHESRLALQAIGLDVAARSPAPEEFREWHEELVTRTVALAVRMLDVEAPLAPLEEWHLCDDAQINSLWERYRELENAVDPLALPTLSEELFNEILDAAKKKAGALLTSYGSSALASFSITLANRPAT